MTSRRPGDLVRLEELLDSIPQRIVACSGGVDSVLLATVAHRQNPRATVVAHTVTPAVPSADTARVVAAAGAENWRLELIRSSEFDDERYLNNPTNRCYFCKSHLYSALDALVESLDVAESVTVLSGANVDDLGEYRPGLKAAAEHHVRHPYVEVGMGKRDIRSVAGWLGLSVAELPASPCLSSRFYTGTRIDPVRLHAVEIGEATLSETTGIGVVRCRVRGDDVLVEVPVADRHRVSAEHLALIVDAMRAVDPKLASVALDDNPYRPGRAVLEIG
jgi:pyridinium-3,5-biscarboxylic acid mononucleotide sulfurtransferase